MVRRMDDHVSRLERIHELDFKSVRILFNDVVGFHPSCRARAPGKAAAFGVRQQGAQSVMHRLMAKPKMVKDVTHCRHVKFSLGESKQIGIGLEHGSVSPEITKILRL